jgi:cell division protein FtsB
MFDFHEKRKIKSVLYSKVIVSVLIALSIALSFSVYNRFTTAEEMEARLNAHRATLVALEERAAMLQAKVEYLKNQRGVEEELRNRFDVAREGEKVVVLINKSPENTPEASSDVSSDTENEKKSFFSLFKFW